MTIESILNNVDALDPDQYDDTSIPSDDPDEDDAA